MSFWRGGKICRKGHSLHETFFYVILNMLHRPASVAGGFYRIKLCLEEEKGGG